MADAKFKVLNLDKCEDDCAVIPWDFTMKNADEDGYKKVDFQIDLQDTALDENVNVSYP